MKYIILILSIFWSLTAQSQAIQLYQLAYAPDTSYHIGAYSDGEPVWIQDGMSGAAADTQYLNPIPSLAAPVGFYLTDARDTVVFAGAYQTFIEDQDLTLQNGKLYLTEDPTNGGINLLQLDTTNLTITGTAPNLVLNSSTGTDVNLTAGTGISFTSVTSGGFTINSTAGGVLVSVLASDFTSVLVATAATGLSVSLPSAGTYRVQLVGAYSTVATTTGCTALFTTTATMTSCVGYMAGAISNQAVATELKMSQQLNTLFNLLTTTGVSATNQNHNLEADMIIKVTSGGNITFNFGTEVATSAATLKANSSLIVTQL